MEKKSNRYIIICIPVYGSAPLCCIPMPAGARGLHGRHGAFAGAGGRAGHAARGTRCSHCPRAQPAGNQRLLFGGKSLGSAGTAPLSEVAQIRDLILLGIIIFFVIFPIGLFLTGLIPCPGLCASSGPAEWGEHTGSCQGARGRICPSLAHFPCSRALE